MPPTRLDPAGEERFWLGVRAAERFFMGEAEVQKALDRLVDLLNREGIPYAVIGAMALNEFGYRRVTVDVNVLLTPEGLAAFKARHLGCGYVEKFPGSRGVRDAEHGVDIDVALTGSYGMPSVLFGGATYPMEIIPRPEQLTIIHELHNDVRRIYLGTRNMPEADRLPGRNGYSSAHWEGDTLVVETTKLVEQVDQRYPHSDRAQVVERYQLTRSPRGERMLVVDMTMTDPVFYTRPVTGQKKWVEVPNGHLLPYDCAEEGWRKRMEQLEKSATANR